MTGGYWEMMYTDLLKRVDAGEFSGKPAAQPQCAPEPGWGQIVQLLLRAMDTSPKTENAAALAERMADGIQCLYGTAREKPHAINDAIAALSGKPGAEPQRPADALRLLADLFSESVHETWTRGEIINVIEDAIRLGSSHSRPERCGGDE